MAKNYDERSVIASLRKKGVNFSTTRLANGDAVNVIHYERSSGNIGIHTLGKIDFLLNHCKNYTAISEAEKAAKINDGDEQEVEKKTKVRNLVKSLVHAAF